MNGFDKWPDNAGRKWIDPQAVSYLNAMTNATEAKIVVTSTWRRYCDVIKLLEDAGVTGEIIGCTPYIDGASRGSEIEEWLSYQEVDKFVILDDDADMDDLMPFLIPTEWATGLELWHVKEVIDRLS